MRDLPGIHIRGLSYGDAHQVSVLERSVSAEGWRIKEIRAASRNPHFSCWVATGSDVDEILGYAAIFERDAERELMRLCVLPEFRRRGIALALLATAIDRVPQGFCQRRPALATVGEHDLAAQLFLRACGGRCIQLLRGQWAGGLDGLLFDLDDCGSISAERAA